ncbi:MAG: replicative DNA helicase [Aphanothece sp. CMT-3BRIN-NPC111]|jgi:replicative DNA helicase|nr:replicative DNA helicase [Aphanothece sp. CMT-3BRIN-NPC111]
MANELNFQASERSLPPQNVDAEEAVLGGILLDPEAIGRVTDQLLPEALYIRAHQEIYRAALALHSQGKPTDLMSVTTWLYDHEKLENVGGQSKLAQLVERTVSAVNIDGLAALVMDKYVRRLLIKAGNEIVHLGYETATELETVLDQAEQKIFSLTQTRPQVGLVPISDTLVSTFQELESRNNQDVALPGLRCDFYDLDGMTGGFQPSDLIIVAGRPSMGKTSFAINIANKIAELHKLPVAIFSLEMSKEQLVQRLLSTEAKIESNRLRAGRITQNEWESLSSAIGILSELPIFIDDTANITMAQMRSQARRLQAEQGGKLGLILLDYLQLMEGGGDNRVQELSKITRQLKGLARELNVPIIALSQLSRGVEARNNKRPMMSDLRESGCLTGDSLVTLADSGLQVPIRELVGKSGFPVWALNEVTMKLERAVVSNSFSTGIKPVFQLKTRLGRTIRATGNHKFLTIHGWKRLDELESEERIALPRCLPSPSVQYMSDAVPAMEQGGLTTPQMQAQLGNIYCGTSLYKQNLSRERAARLATVVKSDALALLSTSDVYWDEIVSIEADGEAKVYDLTVPSFHNFIANNIVVHNSIEQDADLVIMLYRDCYYNPDSPDRDIAEIIVTKHRNGPTGTIKLLFNPEYTEFKNLAR